MRKKEVRDMKIIASDYDGTLNCRGGISEEDKAAIARFRRAGHRFGVVTGRDMALAASILGGQGFCPDFLISCTGAVIQDADGRVLYKKRGEVGPFLDEVFSYAVACGAEQIVFSDGEEKHLLDLSLAPLVIPPLKAFTQANIRFGDAEQAAAFTAYAVKNHNNRISAHRNGRDVDMPPPSTSKVTGIYEYAKRFDAPEIYTVGDNVNDLSMIREFCGFAVENAVEQVKAAAAHQCHRIADMIAYILENE